MKVLIVGTTVYSLPPAGYSGLEMLCYHLACGLAKKGHQVAVVAPKDSRLPQEVELVPTELREDEEAVWGRYRNRIEGGDVDVVLDSSWQRWATMSNVGKDPQIPIVNWHHTDPSVYGSPAPVPYNLWVGISQNHALRLSQHFQLPVRYVYNGVDTEFYKANGRARGERYVWLSRYTPEKGAAEVIGLAQKMRVGLDLYGDVEIIADPRYRDLCFQRADGIFAKASGGVSREQTVDLYTTHKGFLYWLNWEEPFGLAIAEAQAAGCPPIVSRRGAAPELVRDGVTGFVVDTLAQMEELVKSKAVDQLNRETMRQHIEANFGLAKFVEDWERLLLEVVAGTRW